MSRHNTIIYLELTAAVAAWGLSFIATKIALREVSPLLVVLLRFSIGLLFLALVAFRRGHLAWLPKADLANFALLGFLGISFHQWLQSTALLTSEASTTAWIVATTPIFMALLGWLVLRESLSWVALLGIVLAAFGVLLVVTKGDFSSILFGRFGQPGDLLVLISAPNWALFSTLSRRAFQKHPAVQVLLYVMAFGLFFSALQFFSASSLMEISGLTLSGWSGILFLGLASTAMAYVFWFDALEALPASQVGAFLYLEPLFTVVFAASLLGEALTAASLLGGVVILLGVWLVQRPRNAPGAAAS